MRRWMLIVPVLVLAAACADKPTWEYKVVSFMGEGHDRTGKEAGKFASVTPSEDELNALGTEGWELVGSYLEVETAWVNFGNDSYVTGLQPNVRPQRAVLVFKRKKAKAESAKA